MEAFNPFWPYIGGPLFSIVGAGVLRKWRPAAYWIAACAVTLIPAAPFYVLNREPDPTRTSARAVTVVFIVAPMLITFGIERLWWVRKWAHPVGAGAFSVLLGLVAYAVGTLMAVFAAVFAGVMDV